MRRLLLVCLLAACGQGTSPTNATMSSGRGSTGSTPSDGTPCGMIAADYHAVFLDAVACDPKLPDACTEWRPISVASVGNSGNAADAKITGLCFTVGVGYVTPQQAARLDAIIARYQSAGCTVGACPGLSSMMDRCMQNRAGKFSCGGF